MLHGFRHFPFWNSKKQKGKKKHASCTAHYFHQKEKLPGSLIIVFTISFPLKFCGEPLSIIWPQVNYPKVTFPSCSRSQIQNLPQWYHFNKNSTNQPLPPLLCLYHCLYHWSTTVPLPHRDSRSIDQSIDWSINPDRLCNFCSLIHHTICMGISVITHKLHSHAFCDWFKHYDLLSGRPGKPYNFYGAPDQRIEVL
jgi:hypothetical protein